MEKTSLLIRTESTRELYKESNKEDEIEGVLRDQEAHSDISTRLTLPWRQVIFQKYIKAKT